MIERKGIREAGRSANGSGIDFGRIILCFSLVLAIFLSACGGTDKADWTVLFYFDADNGLRASAFADLQELEMVGSSPRVRLVAQTDFPGNFKSELVYTRRFEIIRDSDTENLTSPFLELVGEADMADPRTLTDFIVWGKEHFPARHYALVLWDHGDAWLEESQAASRRPEVQSSKLKAQNRKTINYMAHQSSDALFRPEAMFYDLDNDSGPMRNFQIREALEAAGVHFDLLVFDACVMAAIEVAYEFKDLADIMIASQELMQDDGLPYDAVLTRLARDPSQAAEAFAAGIIDDYRDFCEEVYYPLGRRPDQTLSAVRLGLDLSALAQSVDQASLYLTGNLPAEADNILSARSDAEELEFEPFRAHFYVDLYDLFSRLPLPSNLATGFAEGFSRTVIREYHGPIHSRARGLSIVFPKTPDSASNYDPSYADYDSAAGTGSPNLFMQLSWDNFLADYYGLKYPGTAP